MHRPEFDFEHSATNVEAAIERLDVTWAVAQDNDSSTWRTFRNRYWPAKYLFDTTGKMVYNHFGEGRYQETEQQIRDALTRAGRDVGGIALGRGDQTRDPERADQTRELYGGYGRNYGQTQYAAQDAYYLGGDRELQYEDIDTSSTARANHKWYLQGLWRNEREAILHARTTRNLEDYFAFLFRARSVNIVLDPPAGQSFDVYIEIDGRALRADEAGADVAFDARRQQPDPRRRATPLRHRRVARVRRARPQAGLELGPVRDLRSHLRELSGGAMNQLITSAAAVRRLALGTLLAAGLALALACGGDGGDDPSEPPDEASTRTTTGTTQATATRAAAADSSASAPRAIAVGVAGFDSGYPRFVDAESDLVVILGTPDLGVGPASAWRSCSATRWASCGSRS